MRQVKLDPDHTSTDPNSAWWLHNSVPDMLFVIPHAWLDTGARVPTYSTEKQL